jgi:hypothetical protein
MPREIDLDAIEAKRIEEVGSATHFPFGYKERIWQCMDPLVMTDDDKIELQGIESDDLEGFVEFYLGDQAEEFVEVGGGTSQINAAIKIWLEMNTDETGSGPTRPTRSSNRTQRRSKQR